MCQVSSFKVKWVINSYAYELDLLRAYEVHSVFHVNLMNPVATDPLEGHWQEPSPLILINREKEWLMKEILDAQKIRRSLNYLIKWVEFDNLTWQPAAISLISQNCYRSSMSAFQPNPAKAFSEFRPRREATVTVLKRSDL